MNAYLEVSTKGNCVPTEKDMKDNDYRIVCRKKWNIDLKEPGLTNF